MMHNLKIEASDELPGIILNREDGEFMLWGRSIPRNAAAFYRSVLDWVEEYSTNPNPETVFQFRLDYFNTLSHKYVADIFKVLERMQRGGANIRVIWYYQSDDEDMKHIGEEFENFLNLRFVFSEY
ncbi:MAG: DUF1987 domain-containing protein [Bacteroidota bacterium]